MDKQKGALLKWWSTLGMSLEKKVSLVFQWEGLCSGRFNMKITERRCARMLNAQQYHCPRFAALNRQEPTTMPLQICLRLYSNYPQWRRISILSWANNKSCWNWILYSMCWVCSLMVQLIEWFVCNRGWFIFEWRDPVNVNKLIKPCLGFLKRLSLLTMLCRP